MGMFVLVTKSDPDTVAQFVLKPLPEEFVCTCNRQPRWSAGQESVKELPDTTAVILVGFKATTGTLAPKTLHSLNEAYPFSCVQLVTVILTYLAVTEKVSVVFPNAVFPDLSTTMVKSTLLLLTAI